MTYLINGVAVDSLPRQKARPLRLTVDQFAKLHGLTMKINGDSSTGYIAAFERVEVMDNGFLVSSWGRGNTINEAIKDYASQLTRTRRTVKRLMFLS